MIEKLICSSNCEGYQEEPEFDAVARLDEDMGLVCIATDDVTCSHCGATAEKVDVKEVERK